MKNSNPILSQHKPGIRYQVHVSTLSHTPALPCFSIPVAIDDHGTTLTLMPSEAERLPICNNPYITIYLEIDDESIYNYTFPPWLINTDLAIMSSNSYMWATRYSIGLQLPMG